MFLSNNHMSEYAMAKTIQGNCVKVDLRKTARKMYGVDSDGDSRSTENTKFPMQLEMFDDFFFSFHFVVSLLLPIFSKKW